MRAEAKLSFGAREVTRRQRSVAAMLTLVVLVIVINLVTMPAEEYIGDAMSVRVVTAELINHHRLAVPDEIATTMGPRGECFYQNKKGNWYSKYGIANPFIYLLPMSAEKLFHGETSVPSDDILYLNIFNVILSELSALYLFLIAERYSKSRFIIWIFVLTSLYATFWWNYLRAQTFEIYLTLFVLGLFFHLREILSSSVDLNKTGHLIASALYLSALVLSKTFYLLLVPPIVALLVLIRWFRSRKLYPDRSLAWFGSLIGLSICVLLVANWYRFDSPFTSGYGQFEYPIFTGNIFPAIWGFLVSIQRSMFLYFPVFVFALAGWPIFWKRYPAEAMVVASIAFVMFLAVCSYRNWSGFACYGPRYLLPIAPIVSLPFIFFLESASKVQMRKWLANVFLLLVFGYSIILQFAVNSLPFYFRYDLQDVLSDPKSRVAAIYLRSRTIGTINLQLISDQLGYSSSFRRVFVHDLTLSELVQLESLKIETRLNYYWFPKRISELH
jgi:hypothetical protein